MIVLLIYGVDFVRKKLLETVLIVVILVLDVTEVIGCGFDGVGFG